MFLQCRKQRNPASDIGCVHELNGREPQNYSVMFGGGVGVLKLITALNLNLCKQPNHLLNALINCSESGLDNNVASSISTEKKEEK